MTTEKIINNGGRIYASYQRSAWGELQKHEVIMKSVKHIRSDTEWCLDLIFAFRYQRRRSLWSITLHDVLHVLVAVYVCVCGWRCVFVCLWMRVYVCDLYMYMCVHRFIHVCDCSMFLLIHVLLCLLYICVHVCVCTGVYVRKWSYILFSIRHNV